MEHNYNKNKEPFWKRRNKHGRNLLFSSAELMWEAACEYFSFCDENPWIAEDWVGKDAIEVERKKSRPYTMSGLCFYLGCNDAYFRQFEADKSKCTEDFSTVIHMIKSAIETQQLEGAMVGAFNANIVSRKLGLADKQETTTKVITVEQPEEDDADSN